MIAILIPAYDCEYSIAKVVSKALDCADFVFVCDDGSRDSTSKILRNMMCDKLVVITHEKNQGKGSALRDLFEKVKGRRGHPLCDVFVTLDADDQHNPEDIPALVKPILDDEADVVIGNRRKAPLFRKMGLTVLDASSNVRESQSGFRAYSQKVLKDINVTEDGFGVDSEIIMALKEMGYRIKSVPINISYNRYSHTKNPFSHGFGVLLSIFVKNSALWAGMGIVFSLVSIILLVDVIHTWEVYHELAVGKMIISSILANVGITQFYSGVILYILNKGRLGK